MLCRTSTIVLAVASFACMANNLQAGVIDPIGATASSFYNGGTNDMRSADHTYDNSGMTTGTPWDTASANPGAAGPFNGTMWLNNSNANDPNPTIEWNLGGLSNLTGFHLWNYNENGTESDRGFASADIQVSSTGLAGSWTDLGIMGFTKAPGAAGYTGENYSLTATGVQFVMFTSQGNFGGANSDYTGLSEIRFIGTPEPSSLILCGLGAIGLLVAARRRRK